MKHATISFGQALDASVLREAAQLCHEADLIIALGSSLVVTPAADLPLATLRSGGLLAIVNRDATPLDARAQLVVHAEIGPTLLEAEQAVDSYEA